MELGNSVSLPRRLAASLVDGLWIHVVGRLLGDRPAASPLSTGGGAGARKTRSVPPRKGRSRPDPTFRTSLEISPGLPLREEDEITERAARRLLLLYVLGGSGAEASAQEGRFAVGANFTNIGPGLDLTYGWKRDLHARLTVHYAPTEELTRNHDIKAAGGLLLDWYPGATVFRLSGGLGLLRERLSGSGSAGGLSLSSRESTDLTPYCGIGWGNALTRTGRWTFTLDLGVFGGGGGFSYTSTASQGERIHLETPQWRPVVATGLSYRF